MKEGDTSLSQLVKLHHTWGPILSLQNCNWHCHNVLFLSLQTLPLLPILCFDHLHQFTYTICVINSAKCGNWIGEPQISFCGELLQFCSNVSYQLSSCLSWDMSCFSWEGSPLSREVSCSSRNSLKGPVWNMLLARSRRTLFNTVNSIKHSCLWHVPPTL